MVAPADAIITESANDDQQTQADAGTGAEAARVIKQVSDEFMNMMMGDLPLKAKDGEVAVGGKVSNSRIIQGDGLKSVDAGKAEDLPIGSTVVLPSDFRGTINDSEATVIEGGNRSQKFLRGQWEWDGVRDDFGNKIYTRYPDSK